MRCNAIKNRILLILITSNRGLCGAFNSNAIKATIHRALTKYEYQMMARQVDFIAIGKKGADFLRRKGYKMIFDGSELFDDLTFDRVATIANDHGLVYRWGVRPGGHDL